jgi:hypothetical protein
MPHCSTLQVYVMIVPGVPPQAMRSCFGRTLEQAPFRVTVAKNATRLFLFALAQKPLSNHKDGAFQASSPKTFMARSVSIGPFFALHPGLQTPEPIGWPRGSFVIARSRS